MRLITMMFILIGASFVGCAHAPKASPEKSTVVRVRHEVPEKSDRRARAGATSVGEPADAGSGEQEIPQDPRQKCSFDSECPLVGVCDFGHCHS